MTVETTQGINLRLRAGSPAAWICVLYAAAATAWSAVWRQAFAERSVDEGMFENILWNALHGHGLRSWVEGGVPHLAVHFSPVLYLLLPVYALFRSMIAVHAVASILTAIAGWVFFRYAARRLDPRSALCALGAFLLCPTIVLQTFMEFHEQALAVLPLTLLLVCWLERRTALVLPSALALLLVREDNALLVLALGAVSLFDTRRRATGAVLVILGLAWLVVWRSVAILALGRGHLPAILGETYAAWGSTPAAILRYIATHPLAVIRHVLTPVPLAYLAMLLAPVLLVLPFGSAVALAAVPQLAMVLLAEPGSRMFQIRMHYSIAPVVVLLFAAVDALGRLDPRRPGLFGSVRRWAPVGMLAVVLLLTPAWAIKARARLNPFTAEIQEVLALLPDTASIAAPGYLLNHLAARPRFEFMWSEEVPHTEYVVLEDSSRFFFQGTTVDAFYTPRFDSLLVAGGYERMAFRNGWHVYRRQNASGTTNAGRAAADASSLGETSR